MRFIKIDYTAQIKDGQVFDTTDEKKAKDAGIFDDKRTYAAAPIIVGEGQVIKGLDEALAKAKVGEKQKIEIPPEKAYGDRNPALLRIVPLKVFKKEKINPMPGMPVELDGQPARVQTVAGGRVRVDFNHDLAGKTLVYDLNVVSESATDKEKALFLVEKNFGSVEGFDVKVTGKKVEVTVPEKAYRDRAAIVRKASLSAELFRFMQSTEVSYTEVWKSPEKKKD
ncbi:MAG: peptidylprolyl isomerase [Candidatus Altiarchaeota archaeon]